MGSSRWVAVLKLYSPVLNIALHEAPKDERGNIIISIVIIYTIIIIIRWGHNSFFAL